MVVTAVRMRAAAALMLSGALVLAALLVLPPALAAVASVLLAIAVTGPSCVLGSARPSDRTEG